MRLGKYSIGVGDRFGNQGKAQLQAFLHARQAGVAVTPVWNKSHREHTIIGTTPADVRREADEAVAALGWSGAYFVDADHIGMKNVDGFIQASDFFTLDVADLIGASPDADDARRFMDKCRRYVGKLSIPGIEEPVRITHEQVRDAAGFGPERGRRP